MNEDEFYKYWEKLEKIEEEVKKEKAEMLTVAREYDPNFEKVYMLIAIAAKAEEMGIPKPIVDMYVKKFEIPVEERATWKLILEEYSYICKNCDDFIKFHSSDKPGYIWVYCTFTPYFPSIDDNCVPIFETWKRDPEVMGLIESDLERRMKKWW